MAGSNTDVDDTSSKSSEQKHETDIVFSGHGFIGAAGDVVADDTHDESSGQECGSKDGNVVADIASNTHTARFSSIPYPSGGLSASNRLILEVDDLRYELIDGKKPVADVQDFVACLGDRDFFRLAKTVFPLLRGTTDSVLSNADEATKFLLDQIVEAARQFVDEEVAFQRGNRPGSVLLGLW